MAIKIPQFETAAKIVEKDYVYKDLKLDLMYSTTGLGNITKNLIKQTDLAVSKDNEAILNSLFNLFNTSPGERFLFPEYGTDIRRFLFMPLTQMTGNSLGSAINRAIERFEPRVTVVSTDVTVDLDQNLLSAIITIRNNVTGSLLSTNMLLTHQNNVQEFVLMSTNDPINNYN